MNKDDSVNRLELGIRPSNVLNNLGVWTIGDLCGFTKKQLRKAPNLGPKSIAEIEAKLCEYGFGFRPDEKGFKKNEKRVNRFAAKWIAWGYQRKIRRENKPKLNPATYGLRTRISNAERKIEAWRKKIEEIEALTS